MTEPPTDDLDNVVKLERAMDSSCEEIQGILQNNEGSIFRYGPSQKEITRWVRCNVGGQVVADWTKKREGRNEKV